MRVVIALLKHETNTFSPVPTPLSRFGNGGPAWGEDAFRAYKGTATPMGAFIDLAEAEGAEIVTPVAAEAWPSGPVHDDAYTRLTDSILVEVAKGCDCVLLDLHGAMVTQSLEDGEGELLARIRALAPDVPVGVALDLHGNLSQKIVGNATAIAGFKTYPHVDMYETGELVGRIVFRALKGLSRPTMVWGNRPMLPHIMRMGTAEAPMRDLVDAARGFEEDGALAVSVFGGFPHADIHDAGISVVTVTEDDRDSAETICNGLLDVAWNRREEFVYRAEPLARSVARARDLADGPVLLLDHSDNCGSGGTQDVTAVLAEIIRQGLKDVVAFAIHDPGSVAKLIEAGVGAEVTLDIGGKLPMPAIGLKAKPLTVTGKVRVITDGEYTIRGPMYTGVRVGMGRTVVLDTGTVEIVLIERHHEPWDLGCLLSLGIDPAARKYVMLKSRIHYRAGFQPIARHIVECAGEGVTTSDYGRLRFDRVRRPIFPLT
ncbi:microcystinase C [Skermanella aerolata]|uniref:Microcystinase C n=1 Tax=Skermanella aerolata TaxID=393310 RepID=A0A512E0S1_9PROT|nr:M81 family metallopeptidase [Skermanella aerolata]KJB91483.1 MlrC family protein 8 [Skermanella aerolata KACC 11604]GEO42285.1 microcystinase C [Skermanella aerolata]